jgi:hypothetical protein
LHGHGYVDWLQDWFLYLLLEEHDNYGVEFIEACAQIKKDLYGAKVIRIRKILALLKSLVSSD